MNTEDTYLGFPLHTQDDSEEDCRRTSYSIKIDDEWHEILCCSLDWRPTEAAQTTAKILARKYEQLKNHVMEVIIDANEFAGNDPEDDRFRHLIKQLKLAIKLKDFVPSVRVEQSSETTNQ
jgi:hypothetical protein